MFEVELNGRVFRVKDVPTKVTREMGPVQEVYRRMINEPEKTDISKDIDTLVEWFVLFCGNQFTVEDVMNHYPGDRIITDVGLAIAALNTSVSKTLTRFPTGQTDKKKAETGSMTWLNRFTGHAWTKARAWRK